MVAPILATIVNKDIREFATVLVEELPSYIWEVGASSTGKYHPAYSLGIGGLMRHQIAVVRFLNFFFELEQYNAKFTTREMDLMRVAGLVHDGRKSGEQLDYEKSKYTKFDHPLQMANIIRSFDGKYLNHDELEFVAHCIESHMGQWCTDKKSSTILPKPFDDYQKFVHLADYLASRKDLTMAFDNYEQPKVELPDINEYVLNFGKYSGQKLIDVFNHHRDYLDWCKENIHREPLMSLIKLLEEQEKNQGEDEI
jgi:uncharacterized protein (DUF3820 family)